MAFTRIVVAAALGFLGGFVALLVLAWRQAGSAGLGEFLSELGATGHPGSGTYRLAVLCVAGGVAFVAVACWLGRPPVAAAGYLAISAGLFTVSAAVPCADGCPIPVREGLSTLPNFVHFSGSAAAFGLAVFAMTAIAQAHRDPVLRRLSTTAARVATVLFSALSISLLVFGHARVNGLIERLLAGVCLGWLVVCALRLCRRSDEVPPYD